MIDFIITNLNDLLIAVSSIVTGASAICAIVPNGKEDNFFNKMKKVLKYQDFCIDKFKLYSYINNNDKDDLLIKAGIAHLWFVILHPFEDGNGRIARALTDMLLARSDDSKYRFYSMSAQIQKTRKDYYNVLEKTQKGTMDITKWLEWFLNSLLIAIKSSDEVLSGVLKRAEFWQKHAGKNFNERQKKILNKLLDDFVGKLTTTKWAAMCGCSQDSANTDINELIEMKILKRVGKARATHYVLK